MTHHLYFALLAAAVRLLVFVSATDKLLLRGVLPRTSTSMNTFASVGLREYEDTLCPKGKFASSPYNEEPPACLACASGTYNPSSGSNSSSACLLCPPGSVTDTSPGATSCTPCSAGNYSAFPTQACQPCREGYVTNKLPGGDGASKCLACPVGWYSAAPTIVCKMCPAGSSTNTNSSPGASTCSLCKPGNYFSSSTKACEPCPAGTYVGSSGSTSCAPCNPGSMTNTLNSTGASSCVPCSSGKFSLSSQIACQSCPANMTTFEQSATACSLHFSFTNSVQRWVVPKGAISFKVDAFGAAGGDTSFKGGLGGYISVSNVPTAYYVGQTLFIYVGGHNSYNGGGNGDSSGISGGGATDLRTSMDLTGRNRLVVAGGGGGAGVGGSGGAGGGTQGQEGYDSDYLRSYYIIGRAGGGGGSQGAGGAAGAAGSAKDKASSSVRLC